MKEFTEFKGFKIGDWVISNNTGHTLNNSSFPTNKAWKIKSLFQNEYNDKHIDQCFVSVDKNSSDIVGITTNSTAIRHANLLEIPVNYRGVENSLSDNDFYGWKSY